MANSKSQMAKKVQSLVTSAATAEQKCVYLVREDAVAEGGVWQRECGMAATHRAEKNKQLTLCGRHAAEVERGSKFKIRLLNEEQPVSQNEPTNL